MREGQPVLGVRRTRGQCYEPSVRSLALSFYCACLRPLRSAVPGVLPDVQDVQAASGSCRIENAAMCV
jgi:hypothetical protein